MRHKNKIINTLAIVLISATLSNINHVNATDGDPIMDLGIFSWIMYQKKQFFTDIVEISIENNKIHETDVLVSVYQPIIFENKDSTNHRLVFIPDMENKMDFAYTSPVIKAEERWGLEIHSFGVFPYQCSLHPKERGKFTVKL
ncbi:MAG: plastocyanin [Gammaproteobacteria bacterium]|jgi:plastocyanin